MLSLMILCVCCTCTLCVVQMFSDVYNESVLDVIVFNSKIVF